MGRQRTADDGDHSEGAVVQEAMTRIFRSFSREAMRHRLHGTKDSALTSVDLGLLHAISSLGPIRMSDLAAWQDVDKSTITPRVRRLETAGLVRRTPDPTDGRAALLSLTRSAQTLLAHFATIGTALFEELLATWATADRERFAQLLQRLAADVETAANPHRTQA